MRKFIVSLSAALVALALPAMAFAADGGANADAAGDIAIGAALAIGLAAFGCGIGQGLAALGALQGISRNPSAAGKIQTPMIIGIAFMEALGIYALVIAFFLQGKI